jgi:hypothetical protein
MQVAREIRSHLPGTRSLAAASLRFAVGTGLIGCGSSGASKRGGTGGASASGVVSGGQTGFAGASGMGVGPPSGTFGSMAGDAWGGQGGVASASGGGPAGGARAGGAGDQGDSSAAGDFGANVGDCQNGGNSGAVTVTDSAVEKRSGFENGTIAPYRICTTESPNYGQPATLNGRAAMKFFWTQVGYDGTREKRGAEACSDLQFVKDGWYGFQFYLPSPGFPTDKTEGIAQIFSKAEGPRAKVRKS